MLCPPDKQARTPGNSAAGNPSHTDKPQFDAFCRAEQSTRGDGFILSVSLGGRDILGLWNSWELWLCSGQQEGRGAQISPLDLHV